MIKDSNLAASQPLAVPVERTAAQRDVLIAVGLLILGMISRFVFAGQYLYHWDSINFAFSLEYFDVATSQPHVPGYILYVFLGRLARPLFVDAQATFAGISVISSGLAAAFLYLLGRDLFSRRVGFAAALLLLSSPLFWFYGEIALPHTLDTFMVIFCVWLFYRLIRAEGWFSGLPAVLLTAVVFGLAGGLRPQTQVFLMPLAFYTGWKIGWRRSLLGLIVLGLVDLAWFIPLITLNGGWASYFDTMGKFSEYFNTTTSVLSGAGLWGLVRNLRKLIMYTLYGWGFALIPFALAVLAGVYVFFRRWKQVELKKELSLLLQDTRFWLFVLWAVPTLVYYALIHMGQQGLVFVFLPALLLLSAAALNNLADRLNMSARPALVLLAAANALIFLAVPTSPFGDSVKLLTLHTLREHDRSHAALVQGIQSNFDESSTLILASWWRFPQYYLREYPLLHFNVGARWEMDEGYGSLDELTLEMAEDLGLLPDEQGMLAINPYDLGLQPDETGFFYVVIFDGHLTVHNRAQDRQERVEIPGGGRLTYIRLAPQERFHLGADAFDILSNSSGHLPGN